MNKKIIINQNLLLSTILEDYCNLFKFDTNNNNNIYKKLCANLENIGLLDSKSWKNDFKITRKVLKNSLGSLIKKIHFNVLENNNLLTNINQPFDKLINQVKKNDLKIKMINMKDFLESGTRYKNDFIFLEKIGSGGFGIVEKVYNKIDCSLYAIKKIQFQAKNISMQKSLQEVRIIASLNHINILKYYSSWVEYSWWYANEKDEITNELIFEPGVHLTLHLQTELCNLTLNQWLTKRTEINLSHNNSIYQQITKGITYIHTNNLIHRDLKPSNIFLTNPYKNDTYKKLLDKTDFSYVVKIGDFGLAKKHITKVKSSMKLNELEKHTIKKRAKSENNLNLILYDKNSISSDVGTLLYSAPDEHNSKKSDIYSLGIILFELESLFTCEMDRIIQIEDLKSTNKITEMRYKHLILKMININPNLRVNSSDLDKIFNEERIIFKNI